MNWTTRVGYYLTVVACSAAMWAYNGESRWGVLLAAIASLVVVDLGVWAYRRKRGDS